jgi:hypothetical protein
MTAVGPPPWAIRTFADTMRLFLLLRCPERLFFTA